ncbi:MAG: diaminopimelate epimerase [Methylacidiphilales bacterium]|nr:diaminopimelate epimerase [Candidatus Methylacidiphilales bacterium]
MKLKFWKMSGAGNDFVCVDNLKQSLRLSRKQIAKLCHRQFGVGADGLLALEPGSKDTDFRMRYYNADGGEAEMCGNGARCFARFAQKTTGTRKKEIRFDTAAGPVGAEFLGDEVRVELTSPNGLALNQKISSSQGELTVHCLNTGVPHAVLFVEDIEKIDIARLGAELRFHAAFQPKGSNINFAQVLGPNKVRVRTYERGVENETLACGTGVTAVALIASLVKGFKSPVSVLVQGGDILKIFFKNEGGQFTDVKLHGPADFVFQGEIDVSL